MSAQEDLLQVFHEEVDELLGELEGVLLALESGAGDPGLLDSAFRVLHTIKGTCSMYDYRDAASLAHEVETLFARAREGSLRIDADLVGLALRARDAIADLVSGSQEQATSTRAMTQVLMDRLQEFAADAAGGYCDPEAPAPALDDSEGGREAFYRIHLHPRGDLFGRGVNPAGILDELISLGSAEVVVDITRVPPLEEIDPIQCYLYFEIMLRTAEGLPTIEDALMFLDTGEYTIEEVSANATPRDDDAHSAATTRARTQGRGVRVSDERLDELVNLVGEMVTAQAWLRDAVGESGDQRLIDIAEELGALTHGLRESVLGMRMVPIGTMFGRLSRYVRDLSKELGKDVVLETEGGTAELDRGVIERIEEPLLHLIRNSLDHGIELPAERRKADKPERGTIRLGAFHSGGSMYVRISDDGRGIDIDAVRQRAVAAGEITPDEHISPERLAELVFGAGFTTAERVTAVSGRGVGLDVVRTTVEDLQGSVELEARSGAGVTVTVRLPLTLAIVDGLLVAAGDEVYVLPLANIEECVELSTNAGWEQHGRDLLDVRGDIVPFVRLREFFGVPGGMPAEEIAVIANIDGERFGIVVDLVVDRLQVVIKTLGRAVRRTEGVLGATMLGNGSVALIVDVGQVERLSGVQARLILGGSSAGTAEKGGP